MNYSTRKRTPDTNKWEASASHNLNIPPKLNIFDLSELTHRKGPKRSLVGIGGLEVRERQWLDDSTLQSSTTKTSLSPNRKKGPQHCVCGIRLGTSVRNERGRLS